MLSYDLSGDAPLYRTLHDNILRDIMGGRLRAGERLPSKRTLARNLGISTISIEGAYDQLIGEGYVRSEPKRGYFVSEIAGIAQMKALAVPKAAPKIAVPKADEAEFDFSSNRVERGGFPFSIWARLLRETISTRERELLEPPPPGGVLELREAIAKHLESFRGMGVCAEQVVVGAGTEYLYGLLVRLLGREKTYCVETPGYRKPAQVYESLGARCVPVEIDGRGLSVEALRRAGGQVAHISPTHHFPTGICMPASRRYEILAWASEDDGRFIVEDDYDSEFRLKGRPVPPLYSLDVFGKAVYMNTFSRSLAATIRISYMVLPERLANLFYERLSFCACTVSTFEQYALAAFISRGFFERHINRMRLHYGRKRARVIEAIRGELSEDKCRIIENDSGLHFILELNTDKGDRQLKESLRRRGIAISAVSDFDIRGGPGDTHRFMLSYSGIDVDRLRAAARTLAEEM